MLGNSSYLDLDVQIGSIKIRDSYIIKSENFYFHSYLTYSLPNIFAFKTFITWIFWYILINLKWLSISLRRSLNQYKIQRSNKKSFSFTLFSSYHVLFMWKISLSKRLALKDFKNCIRMYVENTLFKRCCLNSFRELLWCDKIIYCWVNTWSKSWFIFG